MRNHKYDINASTFTNNIIVVVYLLFLPIVPLIGKMVTSARYISDFITIVKRLENAVFGYKLFCSIKCALS